MKRVRRAVFAIAAIALLMVAVPASADQIITFEGYADLTVFTTQFPGVNFNGATVLMKGGSLNDAQFPPHSGLNVVYNPSGPMSVDFSAPVGYFSGYFTYNQPLVVSAYDSLLNLLGTFDGACTANYAGAGCGTPNEYGLITAAGISRVTIAGGGGNNFTLDDVQFTGSQNTAVPEPASLLLLGTGLIGAVRAVRRKRG